MQESKIAQWLTLAHANGLGPHRLHDLLQQYQTPQAILKNSNDLPLNDHVKQQLNQPDQHKIEQALAWLNRSTQHHIIPFTAKTYPKALANISAPPMLLYVEGNITCLTQPQIAIVGSRRASPYGIKQSRQFAAELTHAGLGITSGLAIGIDGAAHQGALESNGNTIAVLGSGLTRLYPKRHRQLAENIKQNGAIISEYPLSMPPLAENFPRRNRIISGLCLGTLVIEATIKSGSLITARYANEQGREVFAMPGAISHPASAGAHQLIQQGAKLVTSTTDILEEIASTYDPPPSNEKQIISQKLDPPLRDLLECVDFTVTRLDDIYKISNLPINEIAPKLLCLEIMGYIKKIIGGYIRVT